jgi:hypothetical protein
MQVVSSRVYDANRNVAADARAKEGADRAVVEPAHDANHGARTKIVGVLGRNHVVNPFLSVYIRK